MRLPWLAFITDQLLTVTPVFLRLLPHHLLSRLQGAEGSTATPLVKLLNEIMIPAIKSCLKSTPPLQCFESKHWKCMFIILLDWSHWGRDLTEAYLPHWKGGILHLILLSDTCYEELLEKRLSTPTLWSSLELMGHLTEVCQPLQLAAVSLHVLKVVCQVEKFSEMVSSPAASVLSSALVIHENTSHKQTAHWLFMMLQKFIMRGSA